MNKKKNAKMVFSSANLFFLCISLIFMFSYYYNDWQRNRMINESSANTIFLIMGMAICCYFPIRFPIFIKVKYDDMDETFYSKIYCKKQGFWMQLYKGFFHWTKSNDSISLFSNKIIKLGIKNRECKFTYNNDEVKIVHRIYDVILTIISSIAVFFFTREFSKMGIVFGITLATFSILFVFKNTILNRIFSVNIEDYESYKLAIMYPYSPFDGVISRKYGFAYYKDNTILIHKNVFCGGEVLKKYIIAHEIGHLKTSNRIKNFSLLSIFILVTYLFFVSVGALVQVGIESIELITVPLILFVTFLIFYLQIIRKKNESDEILADIYAIKTIGKESVLSGLEAIKNDELYVESGIKLSGTSIDGRIKFVKEYECE